MNSRYPAIDWPEDTILNMLFPSIYRKAAIKALKRHDEECDRFFTLELSNDLGITIQEAHKLRHPNEKETI